MSLTRRQKQTDVTRQGLSVGYAMIYFMLIILERYTAIHVQIGLTMERRGKKKMAIKLKRMEFWQCYDPVTDSIFGCKTGSLVYKHEVGHRVMQKLGWNSFFDYMSQAFILLTIAFLITQNNRLSAYAFITALSLQFIVEIMAWLFAFGILEGDKNV